jgi:hypothetical protein
MPMHHVHILSSSIVRNVQEAKFDFSSLSQELVKLKNLIIEQKGLSQAYYKPLGKALQLTEQALLKSVGYSETVTMVSSQLHLNQKHLAQLQEFIGNGKLPENQNLIEFLESIKRSLAGSKQCLCELLASFDGLRICWNEALENLQSCLELSSNVVNASKRWESISESANKYSYQVQERIQHLIDMTKKIQDKTNLIETPLDLPSSVATVSQFEQIVIAVDEKKRKAEAVLLESLLK